MKRRNYSKPAFLHNGLYILTIKKNIYIHIVHPIPHPIHLPSIPILNDYIHFKMKISKEFSKAVYIIKNRRKNKREHNKLPNEKR